MNKRLLMAVTLALWGLPSIAFSQAAAEYAAAAGSAASLTAKTASGLAQGTQQLAGHIQEKMSKPLPSEGKKSSAKPGSIPKLEGKSRNTDAVMRGDSAPRGVTIVSIEGAQMACSPKNLGSSKDAPADRSKDPTCRTGKPEVQNEQKSVINLSFQR